MKNLTAERVKTVGDLPSPRFGHTFTMVSSSKAVLFGGAVSLANKFVITNETFLFDFITSKWTKLNFKHDFVPSERAAHASVMVSEMQMIIYGGAASGNQGLLKDELYILDIRKDPIWKIIDVSNKQSTPGQRYGHTMLFNKPYLIVFGGNSGSKAENDVWLLNILKGPFTWQKYEFQNKIIPCPRVYHSAAICEEGSAYGMMVVFGGRKETKKDHNGSQKQLAVAALNDIWGLRKHRDGSWDWVTPPKSQTYTPVARYQHLVCFMGSMMIIMGGRSNNPDEHVSVMEIYDTQKSEWTRVNSLSRYRHAIALYNKNQLFVHGGFQPELASQPLESMVSINLSPINQQKNVSNNNWMDPRVEGMKKKEVGERKVLTQNDNIQNMTHNNNSTQSNALQQVLKMQMKGRDSQNQNEQMIHRSSRIKSAKPNFNKTAKERDLTPSRIINSIKNIRLSNQAVVAMEDNKNTIKIQRVPVNQLMEESKKLTTTQEDMHLYDVNVLEFAENVIQTLFAYNKQKNMNPSLFPFKKDKVMRLCQEAMKLVKSESSLIGVRPPVKIFGSIYGRFHDLLRLFQNFGFPDEQEMQSNEYVFLGNYVDKGFNSLETICLLMALKIKYPEHIIMLRGKHEDSTINRVCGLGEQCSIRLAQNINQLSSVFSQLNNFFDCLPLAAAIEDKFLCLHSGIGSIDNLTQIKEIVRPVKVRNNQVVMDLLWSGTKGEKKIKYEAKHCTDEEIQTFLESNCLQILVNTRDGLPHGVNEENQTLSVFSITDYANSNNKAGILKISKNLSIVPYLLNSSPTKRGNWVNNLPVKSTLNFTSVQNEIRNMMFEV